MSSQSFTLEFDEEYIAVLERVVKHHKFESTEDYIYVLIAMNIYDTLGGSEDKEAAH